MTSSSPIVHVVDDDDSVRTAVARLLRAAGYEVRVHASAGDFLLNRQSDCPACVILDVRMPGLKRAKTSELLLGDPAYHRELLAQRVGV